MRGIEVGLSPAFAEGVPKDRTRRFHELERRIQAEIHERSASGDADQTVLNVTSSM